MNMDSSKTGMTRGSLHDLWAELKRSATSEETGDLRMRLCYSTDQVRVFGGVSGSFKLPAVVIEVPVALLPRDLQAVSGTRLTLTAAELPGLPAGRGAIVVQLQDERFEDLFGQLGDSQIESICSAKDSAEAVRGAVRQIERWRRFLERRRGILSDEEVRGLIGELAILERLICRLGPEIALRSWKSPLGSIRDFECPDIAVEVKTFMTSVGATVRISDPQQLQPEPDIPLLLACLELSRTKQSGRKLPDYVSRVACRLNHDMALVEEFENCLALVGYLSAHADLYPDGFSIGGTSAFLVRDDFPRIRPAEIPAHVVRVQFSLEVLSLGRFSVEPDVWIGPLLELSEQA